MNQADTFQQPVGADRILTEDRTRCGASEKRPGSDDSGPARRPEGGLPIWAAICNPREAVAVECEPAPSIASAFADSVSTNLPTFAVTSSPKRRRMRARSVSNASRYSWRLGQSHLLSRKRRVHSVCGRLRPAQRIPESRSFFLLGICPLCKSLTCAFHAPQVLRGPNPHPAERRAQGQT